MTVTPNCTKECERQVTCNVCRRRKKPIGRDSIDNGLCDHECEGYRQGELPGHLWPGELERRNAD